MKKIAIVTDSNSGITQKQAEELGIFVLPMPFSIDGEMYFEDITLTQEEFYKKLMGGANVVTSQPSPGSLIELWDKILESYDEVIHIPMSAGLSGSCQTAQMLADSDYPGKVFVVDSRRISFTQIANVHTALDRIKEGKSALEIQTELEKDALETSIYVCAATLEYLKKGGRITPAAALLGGMLKIKPILHVAGEKIDSFAKARTVSKAYTIMLDALQNDIETKLDIEGKGKNVGINIAYSYDEELAKEVQALVQARFENHTISIHRLSLSVSCHTGPGTIAIGSYVIR